MGGLTGLVLKKPVHSFVCFLEAVGSEFRRIDNQYYNYLDIGRFNSE